MQNLGRALAVGVALILLVIGGKLAFWVIDTVKVLLDEPQSINLIAPLVEAQQLQGGNAIEVEVRGETILIKDSPYFRTLLAIGVFFILFNVLGRVIAAFITGGVRLLYGIFGPAPRYYGSQQPRD
jgi:hypothetical protein